MKRRSLLQVLGLAGAGTLLSGCEYVFGRDWAFNEKLSLVVSTPTGDKTGVAVTHWQMSKSPGMFYSLGGLGGNQTGEAAVIDLGEGKLLFALLGKPDPVLGLYQKNQVADGLEDALDEMTSKKISSAVPADQYPLLVTFDNIADPKSVKQVKPSDLAATFGAAHHLAADVSDARSVFRIEGAGADAVIARLCPVDLQNLPGGEIRRTRAAQVACALWRADGGITLVAFRSVARYVFDILANAAR